MEESEMTKIHKGEVDAVSKMRGSSIEIPGMECMDNNKRKIFDHSHPCTEFLITGVKVIRLDYIYGRFH